LKPSDFVPRGTMVSVIQPGFLWTKFGCTKQFIPDQYHSQVL